MTIYIRFIISTLIVVILTYNDSIAPLSEEEENNSIELSGSLMKELTDFIQFVNAVIGMISNVLSNLLPTLSILTDHDFFFLSSETDTFLRFKYSLLIGSLIPWAYMLLMISVIVLVDKIKKFDAIQLHECRNSRWRFLKNDRNN